jgi:phospholipid/cholesterol/gamma-HCH transport system substrate-binding protein
MAFALLLLVSAAAGLIWYHIASDRYVIFEILTDDPVSGLIADSPVEFHGVDVGEVKEVQLTGPHSVRILLSVRRDVPVTQATVATITSRGLATRGFTGYVCIALEDSGADSRPLTRLLDSPYPRIASAPSRSLDLDTVISEVKEDVQVLTDLMHTVLDQQTIAALKGSIYNLQKMTQSLSANSDKLDAIILNAQRATANAERATANAERLSRQAKPLLDSSQETVAYLQTQVLPQADEMLMNLQEASVSLKEITTELERNPSVVVRGKSPPPPGPGEKK